MVENKQKLHRLIDSITDSGTIECLVAFIALFLEKWGGAEI